MTVLESKNIELLGHYDFDGEGDCMQMMLKGDILYVGHMGYFGRGTSILDVSNPRDPQFIKAIPYPRDTHTHKVQLAGDILLVNHEQQLRAGPPESHGLMVYDVSKPTDPVQIGFLPIKGLGVHRIWWTGDKYAYFSVREEDYLDRFLMVADMSDPANPRIHSRWWHPGQWTAGGEKPTWDPKEKRVRAHHVVVKGDRAYGGYGDGGIMIFGIDDGHLELISQVSWYDETGGHTHTHTGFPLLKHNVMLTTDEPMTEYCQEAKKTIRAFDISDETNPVLLGMVPEPQGDFCERGERYGSHNFHENRPGTFISEDFVFATYFNAGLRVYDVRDPKDIKEFAKFIPESPPGQKAAQINDILVAQDGTIYVSDRLTGGIYILRLTQDLP